MKNLNNISSTQEMSFNELSTTNGGGFGYDAGFFVRELVIYMVNGGGPSGTAAAAVDFGVNYRPVN